MVEVPPLLVAAVLIGTDSAKPHEQAKLIEQERGPCPPAPGKASSCCWSSTIWPALAAQVVAEVGGGGLPPAATALASLVLNGNLVIREFERVPHGEHAARAREIASRGRKGAGRRMPCLHLHLCRQCGWHLNGLQSDQAAAVPPTWLETFRSPPFPSFPRQVITAIDQTRW